MAEPIKASKRTMIDMIHEALTTNKSLDSLIKERNFQHFKITKSDVKFLVNNLGYIAQDKLADLTDEGLQKIKSSLGKKKFLELVTVEDAQAVIGRMTKEYQKLSQKVGDRVKSVGKTAKGKKK